VSPSLHTYIVGTVIFPGGFDKNIARYQLRAAVSAPGFFGTAQQATEQPS
jgi:hypothetical protein